jgi:hypothetical protein
MNKKQIIELWKSVGWNNLNDYHEYLKSADDRLILAELDPDKINPKTFWQAADEHFGTDPVCNHNNNPSKVLPIHEANSQNYRLAVYTGMAGQTLCLAAMLYDTFGKVNIAEIGCGYACINCLYQEIENKYWTKTSYTGFDIIKRTEREEDVVEIEGEDGTFSSNQVLKYNEQFNLFYSSNTFQHLSKKQVEKYLTQVYHMLPYGGFFNVMYTDSVNSYHYGQKIELFNLDEFQKLIKDIGYSIVGYCSLEIPNSLTPHSFVLKK